jgi:hypothetical protein
VVDTEVGTVGGNGFGVTGRSAVRADVAVRRLRAARMRIEII